MTAFQIISIVALALSASFFFTAFILKKRREINNK